MIRQPTPITTLYAWWTDAVSGDYAPRHDADPQCGFYKRRLTKGGPWVPVRIWCERDVDEHFELTGPERLACESEGRRVDPAHIWTTLRPITRAEYEALVSECARNPMMAATMARVDLTERAARP